MIENFAQKHALKKSQKNMWNYFCCCCKFWQVHGIGASFSCFAFINPQFAQIIKHFAKLCDCMIAEFRNSGSQLQCTDYSYIEEIARFILFLNIPAIRYSTYRPYSEDKLVLFRRNKEEETGFRGILFKIRK